MIQYYSLKNEFNYNYKKTLTHLETNDHFSKLSFCIVSTVVWPISDVTLFFINYLHRSKGLFWTDFFSSKFDLPSIGTKFIKS